MKLSKIGVVLMAALVLVACGRSKEAQLYVLNPIEAPKQNKHRYTYLRIGIDEVKIPGYIEKLPLSLHYTAHQVSLQEYHQWAEALNKNIERVVRTNLATLLPGALVATSPWDALFKPSYHLQITVPQFSFDINGNSILRAEYLIYHNEQLIEKRDVYYYQKMAVVTPENMVISMNNNLTNLSRDIAKHFSTRGRE